MEDKIVMTKEEFQELKIRIDNMEACTEELSADIDHVTDFIYEKLKKDNE